jgi:hypothetical protein
MKNAASTSAAAARDFIRFIVRILVVEFLSGRVGRLPPGKRSRRAGST